MQAFLALLAFLAAVTGAFAQGTATNLQCIVPGGSGANQWQGCPIGQATSTNASSTITLGGSYQSVFASNTKRQACTIQNNGTHTMWVFFGPIASATHNTSIALAAGQSVNCDSGLITLTDQVSIDGTTSDVFFAASQ